MKVQNEAEWQQRLAEFAADPHPMSATLRDFLVTWADHAENLLAEQQAANDQSWGEPVILSPMQALRRSLRFTEVSLPSGRLPSGFIGAALTLLAMHWIHGEPLYDDMTPIEQHLTEDAALVKIQQLQTQAEEHANG